MHHDVFISYASKDSSIADAVCSFLESKRIRCWIAPRDILPGVPYAEAIIDALDASRLFVLVFSSEANSSSSVAREVERACNKELVVVSVRIEDASMSKQMEYYLSAQQWLDALTPPLEEHLDYLAHVAGLLLERRSATSATSDDSSATTAQRTGDAGTALGHQSSRLTAVGRSTNETAVSNGPAEARAAVPRDEAYIWVTWITGLLSGDKKCEWAAWFRSHFHSFTKAPIDFDLSVWKARHSESVRARVDELRAEGWTAYVEEQNKFTLVGRAGVLGGVPDIVAVCGDQGLVVDCKSGKYRESDLYQVLVYMLALPYTHQACRGICLAGELQYRDERLPIGAGRLTEDLRVLIERVIQRVAGDEPAKRVPSPSECRFCDITSADCPERVDSLLPGTIL